VHILLAILKIIGIIILVILGLLLLILLLLMFVPLRYSGRISSGGDITATKDPQRICVRLEVSWLMKLIYVRFELKKKKVHLLARAAWKVIMQRGEPEEDTAKAAPATGGSAETAGSSEKAAVEEAAGSSEAAAAEEAAEPAENEVPGETGGAGESAVPVQNAGTAEPAEPAQSVDAAETEGSAEITGQAEKTEPEKTAGTGDTEPEKNAGAEDTEPEKTAGTEDTEPEKNAQAGRIREEAAPAEEAIGDEKQAEDASPEKKGWKHLVSSLKDLVVRGYDLIRNFPERLDAEAATQYQRTADLLFELLDKADMKAEAVMRSVEALETKAGRFLPLVDWVSRGYIGWVLYKVKKMVSHYRVRRGDGYIRFGTGRPDLTGLAGGMLWTVLPVDDIADPGMKSPESGMDRRRKRKLILETDFYEMALDADAQFEGHIRICHVVWLVLQALCRRDTWMMLRKVRGKDPYGKRRKKSR